MTYTDYFRTPPALSKKDFPKADVNASLNPLKRLARSLFLNLVTLLILLLIWQYINTINDRVPGIFDTMSFLITELREGSHGDTLESKFWSPLGLSLLRYVIGLAIGIPIGTLLGLIIGASKWGRGLLNDTTLVLLALPAVVWAFMFSLWFGLTSTAPITAVALTAIPFMAINLSSGVRNIDRKLVEMSRSFRVSRTRRVFDLLIGGTLPSAFTGLRLALMTGWNSLLIVEWFSSTSGVGWRARDLYNALRYPGFLAWILIFVLFITLLDRLVLAQLERVFCSIPASADPKRKQIAWNE